MGFFSKLFRRELSLEEEYREDNEETLEGEIEEQVVYIRNEVDFMKEEERSRYILNCLEQLAEASKELELLTGEYQLVTAYLTDMEEVDALPESTKKELCDMALYLQKLEENRRDYLSKKDRLTEQRFIQVEGQEEEMQEGIHKIRDAEEYAKLVKQDLKRLDRERHAYSYRLAELKNMQNNTRGIATICAVTVAFCVVMLFILQFVFEMDTKLGYMLMAAIIAVTFTVIYLKFKDATNERKQVENTINKLILLQNKVKIRYVNNTQLLNYYYLKYQVENGKQLEKVWNMYQAEKEERKKYEQAETDLVYFRKRMLEILRMSRVKYPDRWVHQASAIVDPREMVELRHELIIRRQALRKQMDYNKELAEKAKNEIKEVAAAYPEYAKEIYQMVDKYENSLA